MRTKIMYIIVALCTLSFMAGFGIERAWGFSGNRDVVALITLAIAADHHKNMDVVAVIAPEEGCPIKQMHKNRDLGADIVYLKTGDWTDLDVNVVMAKLIAVQGHFTDNAIPKDRTIIGITNMVEWRTDIALNKGEGIYIILR